jgi:hypothetical protein
LIKRREPHTKIFQHPNNRKKRKNKKSSSSIATPHPSSCVTIIPPPLNQWHFQKPGAGGSNYFTLRRILLQNIFYILLSNDFSKWRNFIENA